MNDQVVTGKRGSERTVGKGLAVCSRATTRNTVSAVPASTAVAFGHCATLPLSEPVRSGKYIRAVR